MKPLHLLCVIAKPGGFVGAELTVRATGDCFPVIGVETAAEPQYVDTGKPIAEVGWFHHTITVEVETVALLLDPIPHSALLHCSCDPQIGARAKLEIDGSKLDIERLYV
jgi:hypothetical protein